MGSKESKIREQFLFAIVANKEGECRNLIEVRIRWESNFQLIEISITCQCTFGRKYD